jgi:predicted porin
MRSFIKPSVWHRSARVLLAGCILILAAGPAAAVDEAMLKRMEELIQKQQQQIEAQNRAIKKLQKQVGELGDTAVQEAKEAAQVEAKAAVREAVPPDIVTNKKGDKVKLQIYGQVNRAYMWADDGDSSDSYFVDNDSSSSRMGFLGTAKVNDDITIGSRFEFEYQSNPSNKVSQDDKNPDSGDGDGFDERWVDAQLTSKRFGKLYLGKGSTASDGIAEIDLSGTNVVLYTDIDINAGGILWYDDDADSTGDLDVGDVFDNMDGLSRRNRLRYDSPTLWGFTLGGSVLSDGGDATLRYASKLGGFKIAGGVGYANPQATKPSVDHQISGSLSILHDIGLNLTLAGGTQDFDSDENRNDASYYYGKLGYRHEFFSFGETRFAVDYARHERIKNNGDEADVAGFGIVQDFPKWGSEYYFAYRWHDLDQDSGKFNDVDYESVNSIMTGVRVKF